MQSLQKMLRRLAEHGGQGPIDRGRIIGQEVEGRINLIVCDYISSMTFNIERTTIFIFCFCIGLVTQLNSSALGVLKQHITKRIREPLSGNSRFLI